MRPRLAAAAAWVLALGAAAALLQWAGHGALAAPPLAEPGRWPTWLDGRDPVVAAFSLLRLVALAGVWYVVVVTTLGAVLRSVGAASLVRLSDRVTVGPVRRLLAGGVSAGLAASGVAVAAPALRSPVAAATRQASTDTPPSTVTMHSLAPSETVPAAPEVVTPARTNDDRWTVKPGECFWSIAESVLTERWGRAPTDAEIVPYWLRLIDANRLELGHRDDPDLVFPGQVFVVPAP
ncbi:MAG TPA: LysM peptidoglycan-binding domain-containing protein [Acidimicrobiales bacterium]|nr:LysM peptidoglycan-binding domain-containing protein [Acidimicrobiales bacterium]